MKETKISDKTIHSVSDNELTQVSGGHSWSTDDSDIWETCYVFDMYLKSGMDPSQLGQYVRREAVSHGAPDQVLYALSQKLLQLYAAERGGNYCVRGTGMNFQISVEHPSEFWE